MSHAPDRGGDGAADTCWCWRSCSPVAGALLAFAAGGRQRRTGGARDRSPWASSSRWRSPGRVLTADGPLVYLLGGWAPPLGVALRADGLSVVMLVVTAVVVCAIGVYARARLRHAGGRPRGARAARVLDRCCWRCGAR